MLSLAIAIAISASIMRADSTLKESRLSRNISREIANFHFRNF